MSQGGMRFGLFGGATAAIGEAGSDSRIYGEFVDYVSEAEELGFHSVFLVEHHFTGMAQVSASLNLLAYLAARTKRMRLGTAVIVLPWHNPVLLAEQAATVDLLSGGRLDLGIGRGYRHNEFHGFGIALAEAEERYAEALAVLRKAWTSSGRFSHHGTRWHFENIVVEPAPVQQPHPPLWMGAGSPASIAKAGAEGFNLLLDQFGDPAVSGKRIATYRTAAARAGRTLAPYSVGLTRALHLALTRQEREAAYELRARFLLGVQKLAQDPRQRSSLALPSSLEDTRRSTESSALIGPPEEIIARIEALRAVGVDYLLLLDVGGSREALRRFAREVMPAFAAPAG